MSDRIKVSTFFDPEIHKRLKLTAINQGISLQDLVDGLAQRATEPQDTLTTFLPRTKGELRQWLRRLGKILRSGDQRAITRMLTVIEDSEVLVAMQKRQ